MFRSFPAPSRRRSRRWPGRRRRSSSGPRGGRGSTRSAPGGSSRWPPPAPRLSPRARGGGSAGGRCRAIRPGSPGWCGSPRRRRGSPPRTAPASARWGAAKGSGHRDRPSLRHRGPTRSPPGHRSTHPPRHPRRRRWPSPDHHGGTTSRRARRFRPCSPASPAAPRHRSAGRAPRPRGRSSPPSGASARRGPRDR